MVTVSTMYRVLTVLFKSEVLYCFRYLRNVTYTPRAHTYFNNNCITMYILSDDVADFQCDICVMHMAILWLQISQTIA